MRRCEGCGQPALSLANGLCRGCLEGRGGACERCGGRLGRGSRFKVCEKCRREELKRILNQTKRLRERMLREQLEKAKRAVMKALEGQAMTREELFKKIYHHARLDEALEELEREGRIERHGLKISARGVAKDGG